MPFSLLDTLAIDPVRRPAATSSHGRRRPQLRRAGGVGGGQPRVPHRDGGAVASVGDHDRRLDAVRAPGRRQRRRHRLLRRLRLLQVSCMHRVGN